jgi:hypothetical protein
VTPVGLIPRAPDMTEPFQPIDQRGRRGGVQPSARRYGWLLDWETGGGGGLDRLWRTLTTQLVGRPSPKLAAIVSG